MSDNNTTAEATTTQGSRKILNTGVICTWDIYHNRISPTALKAAMTASLYPQEMVDSVPTIDVSATVKKTAQKWRQGRGKSSDKYKGEVLAENADIIVLGVLKRIVTQGQLVKDTEAAWEQVDKCIWLKLTEGWNQQNLGITAEAAAMRQSIDRALQGLDGNDIRRLCVDPVLEASHSIPLRGKGGVVFVPIQYEKDILMIAELFHRKLAGDNILSMYYCTGGDQIKDVRKVLAAKVAELNEQIAEWRKSDRKVRTDTEENFFAKVNKMKETVEVYEQALSADLRATSDLITKLKKQAQDCINDQVQAVEAVFSLGEQHVDEAGVPTPGPGENILGFQSRLITAMISMGDEDAQSILAKHECPEGWAGYMQLAQKLFAGAA